MNSSNFFTDKERKDIIGPANFRKLVLFHKMIRAHNAYTQNTSMGIVAALCRFGAMFSKLDTDTERYLDSEDTMSEEKMSQHTSSNTPSEESFLWLSDRTLRAILKEVGLSGREGSVRFRDIREVTGELIRTDERFKSLIPV